jgi:hypothetical protein
MVDNLVRLTLALSVIMLVTAFFYGFGSPRAVAIEPSVKALLAK